MDIPPGPAQNVERPNALLVDLAVETARTTPEVRTVRALAERVGVSVRVLELRFRDYVGLSPKAMIRRSRVLLGPGPPHPRLQGAGGGAAGQLRRPLRWSRPALGVTRAVKGGLTANSR